VVISWVTCRLKTECDLRATAPGTCDAEAPTTPDSDREGEPRTADPDRGMPVESQGEPETADPDLGRPTEGQGEPETVPRELE